MHRAVPRAGNQDDWLTAAGIGLDIHDHSRRVSFDANYSGQVYYYANSGTHRPSSPTTLQAMATSSPFPII